MRKTNILSRSLAIFTITLLGLWSSRAEVTDNESIPVSIFSFIPCADGGAGEFVQLDGDLHVLITFTINGNNVSGKFHFQPQGITGEGFVTGDKYQGTGVTQQNFKQSLQNGQFEFTFVNNFRMISELAGNNFLAHETFHVTITANGDVTVTHDNLSVECK